MHKNIFTFFYFKMRNSTATRVTKICKNMEENKCPYLVLTKDCGYYIIAYIVQDYPMSTQDIVF